MSTIPQGKIEDTADAWGPEGTLGNDADFALAAQTDVSAAVDSSLGLQPISIRLQKSLVDNLKLLAQINGLGYQPLIRQVLTRFVDCELKALLRDRAEREVAMRSSGATQTDSGPHIEAERKAA